MNSDLYIVEVSRVLFIYKFWLHIVKASRVVTATNSSNLELEKIFLVRILILNPKIILKR